MSNPPVRETKASEKAREAKLAQMARSATAGLGTFGNVHKADRKGAREGSSRSLASGSSFSRARTVEQLLEQLELTELADKFEGITLGDLVDLGDDELTELLKEELEIKVIPRNKIRKAVQEMQGPAVSRSPQPNRRVDGSPEDSAAMKAKLQAALERQESAASGGEQQASGGDPTPAPAPAPAPAQKLDLNADLPMIVEPPPSSHREGNAEHFKPRGSFTLHTALNLKKDALGYGEDGGDEEDEAEEQYAHIHELVDQEQEVLTARVVGQDDLGRIHAMFPRPAFGTKPGEYQTRSEYTKAKTAVTWARDKLEVVGMDGKLPIPTVGDFADAEAVEFAKRAIMRSRIFGEFFQRREAALQAFMEKDVHKHYDTKRLSNNAAVDGAALSNDDVIDWFPLPVFGTEIGQQSPIPQFNMARRVVTWARLKLRRLSPGDEFPELTIGDGEVSAGICKSEEEKQFCVEAIMWSKLIGEASKEVKGSITKPEVMSGWDQEVFHQVMSELDAMDEEVKDGK